LSRILTKTSLNRSFIMNSYLSVVSSLANWRPILTAKVVEDTHMFSLIKKKKQTLLSLH